MSGFGIPAFTLLLSVTTATIATGQGPAERNTEAALERIRAIDPKINSVLAIDPTAMDQARAIDRLKRAPGPLTGQPVLIKDNIETNGPLPTTAGSFALKDNDVVVLVGPTMPPAWKIGAVNGDPVSGGGAGNLAAIAGYPHLTVPMGLVTGLPVGLSFIGPKWSDAMILSLGYAYEQARGPVPTPGFLHSIEESDNIVPLLARP